MPELHFDPSELTPLVRQVVAAVLEEMATDRNLINGKLAVSEATAADLLELNPWQLRDLRREGEIGYTRIVGNKIRYMPEDLRAYLKRSHQPGTAGE